VDVDATKEGQQCYHRLALVLQGASDSDTGHPLWRDASRRCCQRGFAGVSYPTGALQADVVWGIFLGMLKGFLFKTRVFLREAFAELKK
jgi:hypothetical protein